MDSGSVPRDQLIALPFSEMWDCSMSLVLLLLFRVSNGYKLGKKCSRQCQRLAQPKKSRKLRRHRESAVNGSALMGFSSAMRCSMLTNDDVDNKICLSQLRSHLDYIIIIIIVSPPCPICDLFVAWTGHRLCRSKVTCAKAVAHRALANSNHANVLDNSRLAVHVWQVETRMCISREHKLEPQYRHHQSCSRYHTGLRQHQVRNDCRQFDLACARRTSISV